MNEYKRYPKMVLGGGSNILLTQDVDGCVFHNRIRGIETIRENDSDVFIKAGAGEVWHELVMYCAGRNWGGLENLSLIPGSVGAAPLQNIGAYGVELKDVLFELEALNIQEGYIKTFSASECKFGYRESVFKNELKGRFVILNITVRLSKKPEFNISYGTVSRQLEDMKVSRLTVKSVSDAVIAIRRSKLPDPSITGNAGSFFKNPVMPFPQFNDLQKIFPDIHCYPAGDGIKVPAAWLIEQCGFKGYREGRVGCYEKQPLVIVNYGDATGEEIFLFSEKIISEVRSKFGITLSREVNVV